MMQWLKTLFAPREKMDHNEFARRFLSGEDLPEALGTYTPESAMRIAAVYACVTILSETIASLPLRVYRETKGGSEEVPDHWAYDLLYRQPNRYQTSFDWLQQMVAHICLRGNHYALKVRDGGRVVGLTPVHPSRVQIEDYGNAIIYRVTMPDGTQIRLVSEDVLHVLNLATEGYVGLSPIAQAKETFDLAKRISKYGNSVFESGGAKRVLLKFPNELSADSVKRLREAWEEVGKNSAKTVVLDAGGDATTIGMNADEAQYLETRNMTVRDIARIYRVPGILLEMHDKTSSYASTEHFDLMFGKHTIRPWLKRIEARIDTFLLRDSKYFCKFNMDALLRADTKTRTEAMKTRFMHGESSINEWRIVEGLNPLAEEWADRHFIPANLLPIEQAGQKPETQPPSGGVGGSDNEERATSDQRRATILEPIARDIAQRLVKAEIRGAASTKDFEDFRTAQRRYAYRAFKPLFEAAGVEDEDARAELATRVAARLTEGREIDVKNRETEITALLMSVVTSDLREAISWQLRSVVAATAQQPAVEPDESPADWAGE